MRPLFLCIGMITLLYSDVKEMDKLDLEIALITKRDLKTEGYKIGQEAARHIRNVESSGLMRDQPPVNAVSFCNQVRNEAYSLNEQFTLKLAQKDNDTIFREAMLKGCNDYMNGRISIHVQEIQSPEGINTTDIEAIQRMLNQAR